MRISGAPGRGRPPPRRRPRPRRSRRRASLPSTGRRASTRCPPPRPPSTRSRAAGSRPPAGRRRAGRRRTASPRGLPARGFNAAGRVGGAVDRAAVGVQGGGAGDDHEEADDAGHDRAGDHVDALEADVGRPQALVDDVGLDEGETPGGEGGADRRGRRQQSRRARGHRGLDQPLRRLGPVRMGEEAGRGCRPRTRCSAPAGRARPGESLPAGRAGRRRRRRAARSRTC